MNRIKIFTTHLLLTLVFFSVTNNGAHAQKKLTHQISKEVPAEKAALIRITGITSRLTVKSWSQSKVKITVQLDYDSSLTRSEEEFLEDLGISLRSFSNRVDITTGKGGVYSVQVDNRKIPTPSKGGNLANPPSPSEKLMEYADKEARKGELFKRVEGKKGLMEAKTSMITRHITVMVPEDVQLDIRNRYGDVTVAMNVRKAHFDINNGTLDAQDVDDLELTGKLCHANFNNIDKAIIEFENGDVRARQIEELDLDSRGATIEYEKGDYLYLRSQNDDIIIDEIAKVEGRKTYGSIRIDKLTGSFNLEGNNTDIKFRDITAEVKLVKINNKYADVRLPVRNLANYYVDFNGYYSMVFAPFKKEIPKEEGNKELDVSKADTTVKVEAFANKGIRTTAAYQLARQEGGEVAPHRFTSTIGDIKGKHTRFELICNSCTVDFK